MYGEDAAERLAFIGAAKHLGLPLEEIGELPGVWEAGAVRTAMPGSTSTARTCTWRSAHPPPGCSASCSARPPDRCRTSSENRSRRVLAGDGTT
ncbi:MerR family DNA-binding protein [Streptomyces sp. NBC_01422]|uniref:MerR family DNA-binding protein n=1 Tax=Streptomyces sp. NBC_01422 TaxID=2903859 RepID=UPI002E28A31F|nr:MerR family DNA-binding protein [Streptomyces sp. NBC_01422]